MPIKPISEENHPVDANKRRQDKTWKDKIGINNTVGAKAFNGFAETNIRGKNPLPFDFKDQKVETWFRNYMRPVYNGSFTTVDGETYGRSDTLTKAINQLPEEIAKKHRHDIADTIKEAEFFGNENRVN